MTQPPILKAKKSDCPTLRDLANFVVPHASAKWYHLGLQLFDSKDVGLLCSMKVETNKSSQEQCTEVFSHWLTTKKKATWNELIKGLNSQSVNLPNVARKIEAMLDNRSAWARGKHKVKTRLHLESRKIPIKGSSIYDSSGAESDHVENDESDEVFNKSSAENSDDEFGDNISKLCTSGSEVFRKNQCLTTRKEMLEQDKRKIATVLERLQVKEEEVTVLKQEIAVIQERMEEKEKVATQKIEELTDRLEQVKQEASQENAALLERLHRNKAAADQEITTLSERLLVREEEMTILNQDIASLKQANEIEEHERLQAQETQLQTFCNNAIQQIRQQTEAQIQQQIQQITDQMTKMQMLFNAVKPQWLISRREITLTQHELGNGGWGRVVKATFRNEQAAAKCLHHQIISDYNIQQFVREMQISSKCHHPNLLRFLGATLEGNPIILTELMDTNLYAVIRRHELKDHQLISLLQDIASAINYLHCLSPEPIIHRDISSSNVLLNGPFGSKWVVKLSDFGSANFLWHTSEQSRAPGNPTYAAPEVLSPHSHSEKMDVYSFGVLLFEICSSQAPSLQLRREVLPTAASVWSEPYCHFVPLIVSCTKDNKEERPTMSDILAKL